MLEGIPEDAVGGGRQLAGAKCLDLLEDSPADAWS